MAKYDAEDLLESIRSILDSGLNAKIAEVDAEKIAAGKTLTPVLAQVNANAYTEQTWSNKILNYSPAIFYGIEDCQVNENAGAVAKTYIIFVEVVLNDNGQTNDIHKRIQRYARALEELFQNKFAPAIAAGNVKVQQVRPISFKLELDSSEEIKVGGVSLTITLV